MNNTSRKLSSDVKMAPSMFSSCSVFWDKEKNALRKATDTEIFQCCARDCVEPLKYCEDYCMQNFGADSGYSNTSYLERCIKACANQRDMCLDTCRLSSVYSEPNNNYNKCAAKYGCKGLYGFPDANCVTENEENIFDCCRKTCIPTQNLDCEQHCQFSAYVAMHPYEVGAPSNSVYILQTPQETEVKVTEKSERPAKKEIFKGLCEMIAELVIKIFLGIFFSLGILMFVTEYSKRITEKV